MRVKGAECLVACGVCLSAGASDLYFSIDDDANKYWDYVPGWKANSGTAGVLPTKDDTTTFNSRYLDIRSRTPLAITNGVEATAQTSWIGSQDQGDGRVIGLKVAGGSLTVLRSDDKWEALSVGHSVNCTGVLDVASGRVNARYVLVGNAGCGIVTNRGGFVYMTNWNARLIVGSGETGVGRLIQTGGTIGGQYDYNSAIAVGHSGQGSFELSGGVVSNLVKLGTSVGGRGEMYMSDGELCRELDVGAVANATGRLEITGGTLLNTVKVGYSGHGTAVFNAPGLSVDDVHVGAKEGGYGVVTNLQPIVLNRNSRTLYVGIYGEGHVHAKANVTAGYVKISASTNVASTMTVYAGATNFVGTQVCIGSSAFPGGMVPPGGSEASETSFRVPGRGVYILKGGAIQFTSGENSPNLYLGRTAEEFLGTTGTLRGYGEILPYAPNQTNVRMVIGDGQVLGDGEGEPRTLSLNSVVNATNSVPTGPEGTSGWYAVNKGCVLFPRTWYGSGTSFSRCFGDAPYAPQPGLVNSVRFTINQNSQDNNYFRGGVYSTDREDVPVGELPPNEGVVGCWKLGTFGSLSGNDKRAYNDISLTFRYDAAKAPKNKRFSLWRHDGTQWTRVGRAVRQDGEIPRISTDKALAPVSTTFNVGIFAVTADKAGMTILFR